MRTSLSGFTLVELLIVIGILAILGVVAVVILNPAEFLAESRDTTRVNDLKTIEKAISSAIATGGLTDNTQPNRVYVSLPDTNADTLCTEYTNLPALSGGWEYRCMASSANLQNVNGTGWIPLDLTSLTGMNPPLSNLPVDPENTEENYYAYSQGSIAGTYSVATAVESTKYQTLASGDGGSNAALFETAPTVYTISGGGGGSWASIGYGAEAVFNTASVDYVALTALDSTHFVAAYRDMGMNNWGAARIGTVTGDVISYNAETFFNNTAGTEIISVASLDSTHFVAVYRDQALMQGFAVIGTYSGGIVSYGSRVAFNPANTISIGVAALDSTHFVVVYRDMGNLNYGTAIIGTVSGGNVISFGSEYVFNTAQIGDAFVFAADPTHFVAAYNDDGNSSYGTAIVGAVSGGNIINYGAETVFRPSSSYVMSGAGLTSSANIIGYRGGGGFARIGTISGGTTISFGSNQTFNIQDPWGLSIGNIDGSHFVAAYSDGAGAGPGTATVCTVSGSTATCNAEAVYNAAATTRSSVVGLDATHFVVGFRDDGNSNYGTAVVGFSQ